MTQIEKFAANVKQRRLKLNLKQSDVAARANMTQQMCHKIESGKHPDVRISTLVKIAEALECTPNDLLL